MQKIKVVRLVILSVSALIGTLAYSGSGDEEGDNQVVEELRDLEAGEVSRRSTTSSADSESDGQKVERQLMNINLEDTANQLIEKMLNREVYNLSGKRKAILKKNVQKWLAEQDLEEMEKIEKFITHTRSERKKSRKLRTSEIQYQLLQHLIASSDEATELQIKQGKRATKLTIAGLALSGALSIASLITTIVIAANSAS